MADTAAILDVLSPGDALGWWPTYPPAKPFASVLDESPGSLRIGILPLTQLEIPVDEDCVEAVAITARALEAMGHSVVEVSPFLFEPETLGMFVEYVMATYSALLAGDKAFACEPFIQYKIAQARAFSSADYVALLRSVQRQARAVVAQWGRDFDVLLTPSMATTLPRAGQVFEEANANPAGERMLERRMAGFTLTASLSGLPAASFPVHADRDGLPLGIQLIGRPGDDATILQLGQALEQEFDWVSRRPRMDF